MGKFIDLTGQVFGRLTVIEKAPSTKYRETQWLCECGCGKTIIVKATYLKKLKIISCGCIPIKKVKSNTEYRGQNLTGNIYGRLTVLYRDTLKSEKRNYSFWFCQCICGKIISVYRGHLKNGHTRSCGCLQREEASQKHIKHNLCKSEAYGRYIDMLKRCYNPKNKFYKDYKDYGGRGIKVCDRWREEDNKGLKNFYEDMGDPPEKKLQLDRINNNGDYCPENCKWVTPAENVKHKRNTKYIEYKGHIKSILEWADYLNIPSSVLRGRLRRYSVEEAFTKPYIQKF